MGFSRRGRAGDGNKLVQGGLALLSIYYCLEKPPLPILYQAITSLQPAPNNETLGVGLKICPHQLDPQLKAQMPGGTIAETKPSWDQQDHLDLLGLHCLRGWSANFHVLFT